MTKMKNQHKKSESSENSEFARELVPNSEHLQQRILAKTKNLVQIKRQSSPENLFILASRNLVFNLKSAIDKWFSYQPLAITSIAIVAVIMVGFSLQKMATNSLVTNVAINSITEELDPMDQLAWEDFWLIQDELAFANL